MINKYISVSRHYATHNHKKYENSKAIFMFYMTRWVYWCQLFWKPNIFARARFIVFAVFQLENLWNKSVGIIYHIFSKKKILNACMEK